MTKTSGASDRRPVVTEPSGPDWGYHDYDINLALGNLIADTAAAERTWSGLSRLTPAPGRSESALAFARRARKVALWDDAGRRPFYRRPKDLT